MTRRFISEFVEHENLEQVFLVADKQVRANRQGGKYLQLRLADKSGAITALLWNVTDPLVQSFEAGDYLRVKGGTHIHNGALQVIISRLDRVPAESVDEQDFRMLDRVFVDGLRQRLVEMLQSVESVSLRNLAESFLADEAFMLRFQTAPAGVKNHHAYRGGLLEHVVQLMQVVQAIAPLYGELDRDMLLLGAFLHDVGKIDELTYDREFGYSDEGQLLGHLVMGCEILRKKIEETEQRTGTPFPRDAKLHLEHLILSHHGELEFGSPKVPMTLEAVTLHFLDNLDAKLHNIAQLMREDPNADSRWTPFHVSFGRKFLKSSKVESAHTREARNQQLS